MPRQRFKGFTVFKGLEGFKGLERLRGVARGGCWLQDEACQVNVLRVLRF